MAAFSVRFCSPGLTEINGDLTQKTVLCQMQGGGTVLGQALCVPVNELQVN